MSKHDVVALSGREKIRDALTELIRDGAHKLIAQGLELEVSELLSALSGRRDEVGRTAWSGTDISRRETFRPALAR